MNILPQRLRTNDIIGIVSPSAPEASKNPRRLQRAIANLHSLGFQTRLAANATAQRDCRAGTVAQRVDDLHAMFSDPHVAAIMTTVGGYNANDLIDHLDYDLIARHPKLFIGYSDISILHAAIHQMTGLVTIYGPALLPQFGEVDGLHPFTWKAFQNTLMRPEPAGRTPSSGQSISEFLRWDQDDDRLRRRDDAPLPTVVRAGKASGPIVACHLPTLLLAAGTRFWPDLEGKLLFVEYSDTDYLHDVIRSLAQLRHVGGIDKLAGLAIGRMHPGTIDLPLDQLASLLSEICGTRSVPIAMNLDFGHTDPMFLLPWGIDATLDCTGDAVRLSLDQPAVA